MTFGPQIFPAGSPFERQVLFALAIAAIVIVARVSEDTMNQAPVDKYILETLMPDLVGHDRAPSAFLVYLFLWHQAAPSGGWRVESSHRTIADGTGLSKRIIQTAIRHLIRRRLLSADRDTITAVPVYTVLRPWARRGRG